MATFSSYKFVCIIDSTTKNNSFLQCKIANLKQKYQNSDYYSTEIKDIVEENKYNKYLLQ